VCVWTYVRLRTERWICLFVRYDLTVRS
jgi:hypothetical protein